MKFKTNGWDERELLHTDKDGDTLEVVIRMFKHPWPVVFTAGHGATRTAVCLTHKQARQLANKILKELDR